MTISELPQTVTDQIRRMKFTIPTEPTQPDGQIQYTAAFREEMLKSHNKIRSVYGGDQLHVSSKLIIAYFVEILKRAD